MKKLLALFLACILTSQLAMPAWAEEVLEEAEEVTEASAALEKLEEEMLDSEEETTIEEIAEDTISEETIPGNAVLPTVSEKYHVTFRCIPEDLSFEVYPIGYELDEVVIPEKDGTYILEPGEYAYRAFLEYYGEKTDVFTVESDTEVIINYFAGESNLYFGTESQNVVTTDQIESAISFAYDAMETRPSHWNQYCAAFVWACYHEGAGINAASAATARQLGDKLITNTDMNPPRGACVFWYKSSNPNGAAGHAGISLGNGKVIHAWNPNIIVTDISYVNSRGYTYRGWGAPIEGYVLEKCDQGESITPTLSISNWREVTDLKLGSNFGLRGTISTDYGVITSVTGEILNSGGSVVLTHTDTPNTATYNIQTGINNYLAFEKLGSGRYTIKVRATANNNGKTNTRELVNQSFNVGSVHSCVLTKTEAVAPTYFAPGNNEYYTCVTCGKVFKDAAGTMETTVDAETLAQLPSVAYGKCGDNVTWALTSDGTLTISGSGEMKNYTTCYDGTTAPWNDFCVQIKNVVVNTGIRSIGNFAFYGCSGLTSVTISESVTSIGSYAFSGCSGLTSVTIPEGVTSIGSYAFSGCSGLTSITIPEGVTSIGDSAFSGCSGLTSITIPEGVTSIGEFAFSGCSGLMSITIPEGVTSIGDSAFKGCSGLTSIGNYAFYGCSGLMSITIPEGVTSIGDSAFNGCSGLTSVTIPDGVTGVGNYAFNGCSGLTSITIPEGVTSIGDSAFNGCSGLSEVRLSSSVSSIGKKAFDGCNNLTDVFYSGTEQQWNSIQISEGNTSLTNARLHFNSAEVISGSCGKNLTWTITEDGVLKISGTGEMQDYEWCEDGETVYSSAPWGRMGITGLELGKGITRIGECAFLDCADISGALILPRTLKEIGACAFSGCYGLSGVLNFPENLEEIEDCAFQGCYGLYGTLQLPKNISYVGGAAFNGCSGFTGQLEIPKNVQEIGEWAFLNCSGLTNVSILGEVTTIGSAAFGGCSSLEGVSISEGTVNIGSGAFAECTALESIFIPKSVETIDESAFEDCNNLKNVNYGGAKTDWNQIQIAEGNSSLLNATIHYQIQSAPEIRPVDTNTMDGGTTLRLILWSTAQNKKINATWSLAEGDEAYAAITANGTLTAKAVVEPVEITVIAQPTNGEPTATKTIRINPKAMALLLMLDGEPLSETLDVDNSDTDVLELAAKKDPGQLTDEVRWSSSAKTVAQVDGNGVVTLLKAGTTVIQATTTDGTNLTGKVTLNVVYTDRSPRLDTSSLNLNTALSDGVAVDLLEVYENYITDVQLSDDQFDCEYLDGQLIISTDQSVRNGSYRVSLDVTCINGQTYTYPLTIKVTNTLPKPTVKQTAKLNLFYRDSTAPLTVAVPGQTIENVELTDTEDFAIELSEDGWKIVYTTQNGKPDTRGTLNVYLEGYRIPVQVNLTVATVTVAPTVKLSAASSTVNSGSELTTRVTLLDKSGNPLEPDNPTVESDDAAVSVNGNLVTITLNEAKSTTVTMYLQDSAWAKPVKLTHKIIVSSKMPTLKLAGNLTLNGLFTARTAETGLVLSQSNLTLDGVDFVPAAKEGNLAWTETQKLEIGYDGGYVTARIADAHNAPRAGTYRFKYTGTLDTGEAIPGGTLKVIVSAVAPKVKLSATSVKLNKFLAGQEQGTVKVTAPAGYQVVDLEGMREGMFFDEDTGILTVALEDASDNGETCILYPVVRDVETGEEVELSTKLSFKVQAYNSQKLSVSLSAKGKLDTQKDGEIAYTVTRLTNCLGTVDNMTLEGQDANRFRADMDFANGKPTVHLTLKAGETYATNKAYKVQFRFYACGQEILSPVQTVKATQTALKVTAPRTITYYQDQESPLHCTLTTNVPVDTVALNNDKTSKEFRQAVGDVTLDGNRLELEIANPEALKAGKSYTVYLEATPENNAGNVKPVTVKLTVKVRK